jgi:uncharacterized membrane protein
MSELHVPHPHLARRKLSKPATTANEHVGFNGWLAAGITRSFGSMWAFYALIVWMIGWMVLATVGFSIFKFDQYPFTFLLFLSNLVQLWALPVLAVGQQVLSRASDKQALQTYQDAEAVLHLTDEIHRLTKEIHSIVNARQAAPQPVTSGVSGG